LGGYASLNQGWQIYIDKFAHQPALRYPNERAT
jgi:hypothetical protein